MLEQLNAVYMNPRNLLQSWDYNS